jgi:Tol biopolymer transport system component
MVLRRPLPLIVALLVALALVAGPAPSSTAAARPTVRVALSAIDVAAGTTVTATARVRGGASRQRVSLQRRTGSTWTRVAVRRLPRNGAVRKVRFRIAVVPGTTTYRVVLARQGSTPGRRGTAFTVTGRSPGGPVAPEPPSTRLVSHLPAAATAGNGKSSAPSISADGRYVAFESFASDLLPGGNAGYGQVYLWDRATDALTLISHRADGTPGASQSLHPTISADGRYVAFQSSAGLAGLPPSGSPELWRWDRQQDSLARLTSGSLDAQGVLFPAISADGSAIAFASGSTNVGPGAGAPGADDVFLWRSPSTFVLVSHGVGNANGAAAYPAISADGHHVAYESLASNLVGTAQTDGSPKSDVFLWDDTMSPSAEPILVSTDKTGLHAATGTTGAFWPSVSADGNLVAYETDATNVLAQTDIETTKDVYLWSRDTPATQVLVSRPSDPTSFGNSSAYAPSMSADGSRIAFLGHPDDLTGTGTYVGSPMLWTRGSAQFTSLSPTLSGEPTGAAVTVTLSSTGTYAAFSTMATNLVGGSTDTNATEDVYARGPIG